MLGSVWTLNRASKTLALLTGAALIVGCATILQGPDLGSIYNETIQTKDPYRNPVIVVPGILGSRLKDSESGEIVWGAFGPGTMNPKKPENARLIALPMAEDVPLEKLQDGVRPDGALDRVRVNFFGVQLQLKAYFNILSTLGVAGYRDDQLGESGAIKYGAEHYTCFQYDYDWRRDIVESAKRLHSFILARRAYVQAETEKRYGIRDLDVKFDIVAHSMGGLITRYYLRYGAADLPEDGSLPPITWEGARYVENVVFVGPPNAGSLQSVIDLVEGTKLAPFLARYEPAVLGTMPSIYQLLPRGRHGVVVDGENGQQIADLYDASLWQRMGWGLADPNQQDVLEMLLPDIADSQLRHRVALDHQRKALSRARQLSRALDVPAFPPQGLALHLIAGDAEPTMAVLAVDPSDGTIEVAETGPGDGTVLRSSALMDERGKATGRLVSPIKWSSTFFLFTDHLGLTRDPAFTDNILFFLFERPLYGPAVNPPQSGRQTND